MNAAAAPDHPWDRGLQLERTRLAWQRTALSGLAFCLVTCRLVAIYSWVVALLLGLVAVMTTAVVAWGAARRHHRSDRAVRVDELLPGAAAFAAITVLVVVTAGGALLFWLASWRQP